MKNKEKIDLKDRSKDSVRLEEAKKEESLFITGQTRIGKNRKKKLHVVPVQGGFALSTCPEKYESYGSIAVHT